MKTDHDKEDLMAAASIESSDNWKMTDVEEDPIAAGKKLLRHYAGSIIATVILTVVMIFVGLAVAQKNGRAAFSSLSSELMRGRHSVQEHMQGLAGLYWLPDQSTLIANLHDGSYSDTETLQLDSDLALRIAVILADGDAASSREKLNEMAVDPRLADFLLRMHEQDALPTTQNGRPEIPLQYAITEITQRAGMRIYSDDGRKSYERNLPVRATLIGIDHPDFEGLHKIAHIEFLDR